jgi:hypothetical protein
LYFTPFRGVPTIRHVRRGKTFVENQCCRPRPNTVENAPRRVAMGRQNRLRLGSNRGGRTAAVLINLVQSGRGPGKAPYGYLHDVLTRVSLHPANRVGDLSPDCRGLPGRWMDDVSEGRGRRTSEAKPRSGGGPQ